MVKLAKEIVGRSSVYQRVIEGILGELRRSDVDPRHVEAYLRLELSTLDSLSKQQMKRAMIPIIEDIDLDEDSAEQLARTFGL